jgi:hypothetical protein
MYSFITAALIPGLLLSSCSGQSGFKAFERPATATDELPAGVHFGEQDVGKALLDAEAGGASTSVARTLKADCVLGNFSG